MVIIIVLNYANYFLPLIDTRWQYNSRKDIWVSIMFYVELYFFKLLLRRVNANLLTMNYYLINLCQLRADFGFDFIKWCILKIIFVWLKVSPNFGICFSLLIRCLPTQCSVWHRAWPIVGTQRILLIDYCAVGPWRRKR